MSLSDPLLVSDEMQTSYRRSAQKVVLSAGIHRQTWISGYPIFVDVQVDSRGSKAVRKIELQLEKTTTFHDHPAPATTNGAVDLLRVPDHIHKEIILKKDVSDGLRSIVPILQDFKTYQMDIPVGLVSIEMGQGVLSSYICLLLGTRSTDESPGRFFGVRYFLNVQISCFFGFDILCGDTIGSRLRGE